MGRPLSHGVVAGEVVHHALGAITYDAHRDEHVFHTWLGNQGGRGGDDALELTENGVVWWPSAPEGAPRVEFRITNTNGG